MIFDGDVVLVTGAGRGLGLGYADYLRAHGARVVANDADAGLAVDVVADVSTAAGARACVEAALDSYGQLDAVIANAGTSWHRTFADLTDDEFDDCIRHNLYSTYHVLKRAWTPMCARGYGRIVTTSSDGIFGIAGRAHYVAAKGGVLALSRTLATEGAEHGVAVNCVMPWGKTRLARPASPAPPPEQAAEPVARLCHRDCAYNGELFRVGGGRMTLVPKEAGVQ